MLLAVYEILQIKTVVHNLYLSELFIGYNYRVSVPDINIHSKYS